MRLLLGLVAFMVMALFFFADFVVNRAHWDDPTSRFDSERADALVAALEVYRTKYATYPKSLEPVLEGHPDLREPDWGANQWIYETWPAETKFSLCVFQGVEGYMYLDSRGVWKYGNPNLAISATHHNPD